MQSVDVTHKVNQQICFQYKSASYTSYIDVICPASINFTARQIFIIRLSFRLNTFKNLQLPFNLPMHHNSYRGGAFLIIRSVKQKRARNKGGKVEFALSPPTWGCGLNYLRLQNVKHVLLHCTVSGVQVIFPNNCKTDLSLVQHTLLPLANANLQFFPRSPIREAMRRVNVTITCRKDNSSGSETAAIRPRPTISQRRARLFVARNFQRSRRERISFVPRD